LKRLHFETLKPICPQCRRQGKISFLDIRSVFRETEKTILEGILICPDEQCFSEYPITDGIPIIVADLRNYISQNILPIFSRNDLSDSLESLIGDCCGPSSAYDIRRQHLSAYTYAHYGDIDPKEDNRDNVGSILKVLKCGLEAFGNIEISAPIIDMGCSVGRTSFALAEASKNIVIGIDLNYDMLKIASRVLNDGMVRYPKRRVGMVYDRREFSAIFNGADRVDFWACDAMALPFTAESFGLAVSLNVTDCISSPYAHLQELARILKPGAKGIISTPYDWSSGATPVEAWFGGHSQRSANRGASESVLRALLQQQHPQAIQELCLISEIENVPWSVRLHDRSIMLYQTHLMVVQKTEKIV